MSGSHPGDDRLVAFVLDDLDSVEQEELAAHVHACAECERVVGRLTGALARYREQAPPEAPARVLVGLLEAQGRANRRSTRPLFGARWPAAALATAAALAVVFLGGYWIGQHSAVEEVQHQEPIPITRPLPDPPLVAFQTAP